MNPDTTCKLKICAWGSIWHPEKTIQHLTNWYLSVYTSILHLPCLLHLCWSHCNQEVVTGQRNMSVFFGSTMFFLCDVRWAFSSELWTWWCNISFYSSWCFACLNEIFLQLFVSSSCILLLKHFLPTTFLEFLSDQGDFKEFAAWCHHSQKYSKSHKPSSKGLPT